jgi:hypothetical protein
MAPSPAPLDLSSPLWVLAQVVLGIVLLGTALFFASRIAPRRLSWLAQLGAALGCVVLVALRLAIEDVPYLGFDDGLFVGSVLTAPALLAHLLLIRAIREPRLGFYLVVMTVSSLVGLVLFFIVGMAFFAGSG